MNSVGERLYLGDAAVAHNKPLLKSRGVTHIVCAASEYQTPIYPEDFDYLNLNIHDEDDQNLLQHFETCLNYIEGALAQQDKVVFVHCIAGVSRSPTIVIAYLMRKEKKNFEDAFTFVKGQRPCIQPNVGFRAQLALFQDLNWKVDKTDQRYIDWINEMQRKQPERARSWHISFDPK